MSGSTLKLIAIITMFIDHVGAIVVEQGIFQLPSVIANPDLAKIWYIVDMILRYTGRVAFPIFCFLLVEGFMHTSDRKRYALRLFVFALISEIPFDFALFDSFMYLDYQNIYFTLLIGVLVMMVLENQKEKPFLQSVACILGLVAGELLHVDYGFIGVLLILVLYYFRQSKARQALFASLVVLWEITAPLAFVPIWFYNGKRGWNLKYLFYAFYPVHILLLGGIAWLIRYYCI